LISFLPDAAAEVHEENGVGGWGLGVKEVILY